MEVQAICLLIAIRFKNPRAASARGFLSIFHLHLLIILVKFVLMNDPKGFDIELNGVAARVTDHTIKSAKVFHIVFQNRRPPLNITVATNSDEEKFWTSIPEGRQEEAEFAGKAVAAYLREYRRNQLCVTTTDKKSPAPSLFD